MAIVRKKISSKYFNLVKARKKKFELRLADFEIKEGDTLVLEEQHPKTKELTGREIRRTAKYIFKFKLNDFGQEEEIRRRGLYVIQF